MDAEMWDTTPLTPQPEGSPTDTRELPRQVGDPTLVEQGRAYMDGLFPGWSQHSTPCEPGQWRSPLHPQGRHRRQPTAQSSAAAALRFLDTQMPDWREPRPWDQVSFGDGSRCVAGYVVEQWTPPPPSRRRRFADAVRGFLRGAVRHLSRRGRPWQDVSAFDAGWLEDCEDAEETWW